ncbi:MAG TPA: dUTP diphosphatase [Clostridia bacterium]|nr:dUTP diphosphatase [Clostridia bacterium]
MDPKSAERRVGVRRLAPGAGQLARATPGSSGYDLSSAEDRELTVQPGGVVLVRTGLALEMPPGLEGQVRSRSGLAARSAVFVLNSPGTIDSDYRGEVKVVLANLGDAPFSILPGDRIAQLVFAEIPDVCLVSVDEISQTERGSGGFGSTGGKPLTSMPRLRKARRVCPDGEAPSGSGSSD